MIWGLYAILETILTIVLIFRKHVWGCYGKIGNLWWKMRLWHLFFCVRSSSKNAHNHCNQNGQHVVAEKWTTNPARANWCGRQRHQACGTSSWSWWCCSKWYLQVALPYLPSPGACYSACFLSPRYSWAAAWDWTFSWFSRLFAFIFLVALLIMLGCGIRQLDEFID